MASFVDFLLKPGATDGAAGTSHPVGDWTHKSIVCNVPAGSFLVQVSNDGTTWIDIGPAIVADALVSTGDPTNPLPMACKFIRIFSTTANAGAEFAFVGHQANG